MKRYAAVAAAFGIPAMTAAYVALAPLGAGALDAVAEALIASTGRGIAVLALLAASVVLAAITASRTGADAAPESEEPAAKPALKFRRAAKDVPEASQIWRPEPLPEERIASLRRRALGEAAVPHSAASLPLPAPVILIRKPRERARDWFDDRSWLGGLPRLNGAAWPRDASGKPLPFAAQIDLAELAGACPDSPLPNTGSLAFFLGTGAVVAVPAGDHPFSDPPADLPPAFDEGGYPFPATRHRLSRQFFPFWPVAPLMLDLPEALLDHRDPERDDDSAIEVAMAAALARHAHPAPHAFAAEDEALWWHGVQHLAQQLHEAHDGSVRLVALRKDAVNRAAASVAALENQADPGDPALADARSDLAERQAELAAITAQREGLPTMIEAIDQFVAGRASWQQLTPDECDVVDEFLAELRAGFGDVVRFHVPQSPRDLATLTLRTMITGGPDALAAMPDRQLDRINREYRLTTTHQHQMFGLGGCQQAARDDHRGDLLLLQLGYDDLMEWRWGDMGLFQFWISPRDLAAGNWSAAQLTFECA